jgi:2,4-dienoyl-CoA reductase-like NADH-dependent reductase (Old Yellow Enzyme family)
MAEMLAGSEHAPTPKLMEVYNQWGKGGWGAILTGIYWESLLLRPGHSLSS